MRRWLYGLTVLLLMPLLTDCKSNNPYYDASKPHHTGEGFRNTTLQQPHNLNSRFWKWRWQRFWNGVPKEPEGGFHPQTVVADAAFLAGNRSLPTLTWIGHATLLLQYNGVNILTDPQLSERASPLSFIGPKRLVPPALTAAQMPRIDVVVISHNHYDHLDVHSVQQLNAQPGGPPRFFVPLGLKPWLAERGITNVRELDWWEAEQYRGFRVMLVPVQHFSARSPFDRNETLWGGWVLSHPGFTFFFAGDTGYFDGFREIARRVGRIDLAALPIGAYAPRWFMKTMHIDPEEAVAVHQDLHARYSVAMHWGTFRLTDEPPDEPPRRLAAALQRAGIPPERFFVMKHGETRLLAPLLEQQVAQGKAAEQPAPSQALEEAGSRQP